MVVLQPRECLDILGLGYAAFAHHYSRYHCCFLFLPLLRCFSSGGSPPRSRMAHLQCAGLPHSDIQGSKLICSYPWLFAACHVLLRLREPRHPPHALGYFTYPNDITASSCDSAAHSCLVCSIARVKNLITSFISFDSSFFSCLLPACQRTLPHHLRPVWRIRDSNP